MNGMITVGTLKDGGTNVDVSGTLENARGLNVQLTVIVEQDGVQATGEGTNDASGEAWTGSVSVPDGKSFKAGKAIGYAAAVAREKGGLATYQWASFIDLT